MNMRKRLLLGGVSLNPFLMSAGDGTDDGGEAGGAGAAAPAAEGGATAPEGEEGGAGDEGAEEGAAGDEGGEEDGGEGGEPAAAGAGDDEGDGEAKPKRVPWWQKRIDKLTHENKTLKEARGGEGAAGAGGEGAPAAGAPAPATGGYVNEKGERLFTQAEVEAMASSRAALTDLNKRSDALFDQGAKDFPKTWTKRINAAGGAYGEELAKRIDFFDLLTDLPNGAAVYHELTGDLDQLEECLSLPPHKLGAKLATLAATLAKPAGKQVSAAPAPIAPIGGAGGDGGDKDLSKVSMSEYEKEFNARREKRFGS